jgi:hypothetical protein
MAPGGSRGTRTRCRGDVIQKCGPDTLVFPALVRGLSGTYLVLAAPYHQILVPRFVTSHRYTPSTLYTTTHPSLALAL